MFARASLVALALASPAWPDSDYPAGLFERSAQNALLLQFALRLFGAPW